jgi:hypothetical protein
MANVLFIPPIVVVAVGVPAIFPDGHLPSRRWRWLPVMLVAGTAAAIAVPAFTPGMMSGTVALDNPFGISAFAAVSDVVNMVSIITAPIVFVGATAAVIVRYRRGSSVVRHQVKWLAAVAAVSALAFPLAFALPVLADGIVVTAIWLVAFSSLAALPVAIGVAVVRYRLYEIDRLISRTIGWAILTAVLAGVLVGGIVALQAILAPFANESSIAVAASTLVALALFQPLQRRVQRAVDRRFDRARYDGQRTADQFAHRLRSETDMTAVLGDLSRTTGASVAPTTLGVWIRSAESRP